jgi:hypothetical protein
MAQRKQRKKEDLQFGESRTNHEDIKAIEQKAANHHFKPGSIHSQRAIDALDYDRWERQRAERKAKNNTLDPYR